MSISNIFHNMCPLHVGHRIALTLILALLAVAPSMAKDGNISGSGEPSNPYLIEDVEDWNAFAENVLNGNELTENSYQDKFVKLVANIGSEESPVTTKIGSRAHQVKIETVLGSTTMSMPRPFSGVFDGGGHVIIVAISDMTEGSALFSYIKGATIKNLTVKGSVSGKNHVAGLVGISEGSGNRIENCVVSTTVNGGTHIGGILGHGAKSDIAIDNCVFNGILNDGSIAKGVFFGWGDDGGTKTVSNCLYIQQDGQSTDNLDLVKMNAGSVAVTDCYKTENVGTYGTLVYLVPPIDAITEEKTVAGGINFYVVTKKLSLTGNGSESAPYIINNASQWDEFAQFVNNGIAFAGKFIKLGTNISVSTKVGVVKNDGTLVAPFSGTFDGGGYTITALIEDVDNPGTALFCYIEGATIKNLKLAGNVTGGIHAAGIVGYSNGTGNKIENCVVSATIKGGSHIGGILGHGLKSDISIDNCVFNGKLMGDGNVKGVFFGWGDEGGSKSVSSCLYIQQDGQNTDNLDLVKMSAGSVNVTGGYKTANVGTYGELVYLSAPTDANMITEEKTAIDGTMFYVVTGFATGELPVISTTTEMTTGSYRVFNDITMGERIKINGDVKIVLNEGKTLNAAMGIEVTGSNKLTIDGRGTLNAWADESFAGIGGGIGVSGGVVVINGGIVTATGGAYAAGIGGGENGSGGQIVINGGKVTAYAGRNASGMGPGFGETGGDITLGWTNEDDFIYANNYKNVASLSFAANKRFVLFENNACIEASKTNIDGKKIIPLNSENEHDFQYISISGIQPYYLYTGKDINIDYDIYDVGGNKLIKDVDYTAKFSKLPINGDDECIINDKGEYSLTVAAIKGGGYTGEKIIKFYVDEYIPVTPSTIALNGEYGMTYKVMENIIVEERINIIGDVKLILGGGTTLNATKGIELSKGNKLTISGSGKLEAQGEYGNSGIGAYEVGTLVIEDGEINAAGGDLGAGIGGSVNNSEGGIIEIKGGSVTATGGLYGAGIGGGSNEKGGEYGVCGNITITGGKVIANGDDASGMGPGQNGFGGHITLGWTNEDDFIYANNYNNVDDIRFAKDKFFYYDDSFVGYVFATSENVGGNKITPLGNFLGKGYFETIEINPIYTSISDFIWVNYNSFSITMSPSDYSVKIYDRYGNEIYDEELPGVISNRSDYNLVVKCRSEVCNNDVKVMNLSDVPVLSDVKGGLDVVAINPKYSSKKDFVWVVDSYTDEILSPNDYTVRILENQVDVYDEVLSEVFSNRSGYTLVVSGYGYDNAFRIMKLSDVADLSDFATGFDVVGINQEFTSMEDFVWVADSHTGKKLSTDDYSVKIFKNNDGLQGVYDSDLSDVVSDRFNHEYTLAIKGKGDYKDCFMVMDLSDVPEVIHNYAAVQVLKEKNGMHAVIDGEYKGEGSVNITEDIENVAVTFNRNFTVDLEKGGFSTLMLPFRVSTEDVGGLGGVYKFAYVADCDGDKKNDVCINKVWEDSDTKHQALEAYTPYMVKMKESTLKINTNVTLKATTGGTLYDKRAETDKERENSWQMRGVFGYKEWKCNDGELGKVWGYTGEPRNGQKIGKYMKFGEDVWINPFRAYLFDPNGEQLKCTDNSAPQSIAASPYAKAYTAEFLPAPARSDASATASSEVASVDGFGGMQVVVVDDESGNERPTVIGHMNPATGEIRMLPRTKQTYDLKGRRVKEGKKAKGAYYRK